MVNGILFPSSLSFKAVSTQRYSSAELFNKNVKYLQSDGSFASLANDEISSCCKGRRRTLSVSSVKAGEMVMWAK
jgi:hypothetical protein